MYDNVRQFTPRGVASGRAVEEITFEQFCVADAGGEWVARTRLPNGMTILSFPRCVMICCHSGSCSVVRQASSNIDAYFAAALAALDEVA